MDVLFLLSVFRLYPKFKMSFEHKSAAKLFSNACFCGDSRRSLRQMDQNFKFGEPLDMRTRTWSFSCVSSKYLDYMQNYLTLLEQSGHLVVKGLASLTSCLLGHVTGLLFAFT